MLKREWGAESNRKLSHLFISSKTATLVPALAVENLFLGRTLMVRMMMMISAVYTESFIYYARQQTAVARGLA